jgi:hypothetical protein
MKHLIAVVAVCAFTAGVSRAAAQQSVTVTTTADFNRGNNEGLVTIASDRVERGRISAGTLGSWSPTSSLPAARVFHSLARHNGFMYLVGGSQDGSEAVTDVWFCAMNADGSVGSWTSTTSLPSERFWHTTLAYNGFLYVVGGFSGTTMLDEVLYAPLNADGSVGSWSATASLPFGRAIHNSAVHNGFVYVLGGGTFNPNFTVLDDVLVAPLRGDGSVGAWSATTSYPSVIAQSSSAIHDGHLYVTGGTPDGFTVASETRFAPLNADGTVGGWSTGPALPAGRAAHSSTILNGFLYVLGGTSDGASSTNVVLAAALLGSGDLDDWSPVTSLPAGRFNQASLAHAGFLYSAGGSTDAFDGFSDEVLVAPIEADSLNANQAPARLRGAYSHLVDLQGDASTIHVIVQGQLAPGGVIRLQARVAPETTGIFGAEFVVESIVPGSAIEIPGVGRYVWIRFLLDDTGASNVDQPTFVAHVSIGPSLPPTAGVVFDGPGADIATQTSTSTIQANWSGFTPFTGDSIASYEWAIGTSAGSTNVQTWINVGLATSAVNSNLSLSPGVKFVSVRAISLAGLTSDVATSNGVQVLPSTSGPAGGDDDDDEKGLRRCASSASSTTGSVLALLGGIVLLAAAFTSSRTRP